MYSSKLIAIMLCLTTVSSDDPKLPNLCADPIIHSAIRLPNNTVRLFKGDYYWELIGLPDKIGYLEGPYKIWIPNMAPILKNSSTMYGLSGGTKDILYKWQGFKYWAWWGNGQPIVGGTNQAGSVWLFPQPSGLSAVYNDAGDGKLGFPLAVGFQAIRVYYYNVASYFWSIHGNRDGYVGGMYGENFPADITSAFSWPSDDNDVEYYVYLFKRDQHCFRPWKLKSGNSCDEWRFNKELFGCSGGHMGPQLTGGPPSTKGLPQKGVSDNTEQIITDPAISPTTKGNFALMPQTSLALILVSFCIIFYF